MFPNQLSDYLEKGCEYLNKDNWKLALKYWENGIKDNLFRDTKSDLELVLYKEEQRVKELDKSTGCLCPRDNEILYKTVSLQRYLLERSKEIKESDVNRFQPLINKTYSLVAYRSLYDTESGDPVSALLRYLKKSKQHCEIIGYVLGKTLIGFLLDKTTIIDEIDLVISVPLSPAKEKARGYNQSELLARPFQLLLDVPVMSHVLSKTKDTVALRYLSASKREKELEGAFKVNDPVSVKGKNILLVDDVTTYGTTLKECARALQGCNPIKIYAITVAKSESSVAVLKQKYKGISIFSKEYKTD